MRFTIYATVKDDKWEYWGRVESGLGSELKLEWKYL